MTSHKRDTPRDTIRIPNPSDTAGYAGIQGGYTPPQHTGIPPAPSEGAGCSPCQCERCKKRHSYHDLHVDDYRRMKARIDAAEAEHAARGRHPTSNVMPRTQLREDNQAWMDRIDPDRRRFRFDAP